VPPVVPGLDIDNPLPSMDVISSSSQPFVLTSRTTAGRRSLPDRPCLTISLARWSCLSWRWPNCFRADTRHFQL